jgi:hypothetical protein
MYLQRTITPFSLLLGVLLCLVSPLCAQQQSTDTTIDASHKEFSAMIKEGEADLQKGDYRKALVHLKRSMKLKRNLDDKETISKLYYNMAVAFMNMKMYPQALKYYYKASVANNDSKLKQRRHYKRLEKGSDLERYLAYTESDTTGDKVSLEDFTASADSLTMVWVNDNTGADDSIMFEYVTGHVLSKPIKHADITACFADDKKGVAYGVLVHIQQPIPGRKRAWKRVNIVGHTFVTLVKFNEDESYVCRTFGLYPKGSGFLTGTPFHPLDEPQFKNDSLHDWTQVVGKFISHHKFDKILEVVRGYDQMQYNLSTNNCTDFSLSIADIAGIYIENTTGKWPLGRGNNPGAAGQSIIEGHVKDTDGDGAGELFIYSNVGKKK